MRNKTIKEVLVPGTVMLGLAACIVVCIQFAVERVVGAAILENAEKRALRWASEFVRVVPDIEAIAAGATPTADQLSHIQAAITSGDIFRFKVFGLDGTLMFVSDMDVQRLDASDRHSDEARSVIASGKNDVEIEDGREKSNRPDTYVEAYLPGYSADGTLFGAMEVYVDVAVMAESLRAQFGQLGLILVLVSAAAFLGPSAVVIRRTQQLRARDRAMLQMSRFDPLTGVLNRGAFAETLSRLFNEREKTGKAIGLIFIDLDRFKEVNDTHGHDVGDQVLRHTAQVLLSVAPGSDYVGRMGGDEFVVVLPSVDAASLRSVGRHIVADLARPIEVCGRRLWPGASVGAHLSMPSEPEDTALQCADIAAYRAKAAGRGRLVEYTATLDRQVIRQRHVENSVRRAVEKSGFFVEYQPIVHAADLRLAGFEALIRMKDAAGELIPPSEFVPLAEHCGLIDAIGDQVLTDATSAAREWGGDLFVSVNLSPLQFKTGKLVDRINRCLTGTGLDPSMIEMEVTESLLLDTTDEVNEQIADLTSLGITLTLDDFGTGYSSLGYLWKYHFNKIKIDRSFLLGFDFDPDRYREVVSTVLLLARQLNLSVTAEGIETEAHRDLLVELGCDMLQGFLFSRPLGREEARALATSGRDRWVA